ncbi:uncharacterized protein LOC123878003 [Maniola jurtina]|nr:uncharacterized protein LOC123878003 [Maniola jurtina]
MENISYSPCNSQENNTYKQYYFPANLVEEETQNLLIDHEMPSKKMKRKSENIDIFFESSPKNKNKTSSTVARANKDGSISYISTNSNDGATATHLIKLEVYDLKKLAKIP